MAVARRHVIGPGGRHARPGPMTGLGLGRVKTPARHDGLELHSHWPTVRPPRARPASCGPLVESRRNQQTPRLMHFRCMAHDPQSILPCTHRLCDLMENWNRILAIFAPHTFLHSQGQNATCKSLRALVRCALSFGHFLACAGGLTSAMCGRLRVGKDFLARRRPGRSSHVFGLLMRLA